MDVSMHQVSLHLHLTVQLTEFTRVIFLTAVYRQQMQRLQVRQPVEQHFTSDVPADMTDRLSEHMYSGNGII